MLTGIAQRLFDNKGLTATSAWLRQASGGPGLRSATGGRRLATHGIQYQRNSQQEDAARDPLRQRQLLIEDDVTTEQREDRDQQRQRRQLTHRILEQHPVPDPITEQRRRIGLKQYRDPSIFPPQEVMDSGTWQDEVGEASVLYDEYFQKLKVDN